MKNPLSNSIHILLFLFVFSSCKKEAKQAIALCASQYNNGVDLHIKYKVAEKGKRSFVYRCEGGNAFQVVKEINPNDIVGDSVMVIDSLLKYTGNYTYKVSYNGVLSDAVAVNFINGATPFYIPNSAKDTLTIKSDYSCTTYGFTLYNRWGQMIIDKQNLSGNQSFDVSKLPSEIYVCLAYVANREINSTIAIIH